MRDHIGEMVVGGLIGAFMAITSSSKVAACSHSNDAQRVVNTAEVAGYERALDDCKEQGKDAGSYAVYETCAKDADRRFGREAGAP